MFIFKNEDGTVAVGNTNYNGSGVEVDSLPDEVEFLLWNDIDPTQPTIDDAKQSESIQNALVSAVQAKLDSEAQSLGYDDINSIAKYMGYVNDFQAECESLGAWTASVWSYCYAQLALVQAGTIDMPTPDELVADLPVRV